MADVSRKSLHNLCMTVLLIYNYGVTLSLTEESPFADMSVAELYGVQKYLFSQPSLNLKTIGEAKVTDAYIFMIEALRPSKTEALEYLDRSGPLPERAARVIIFRGDIQVPAVQEYKVYPIPNPSKHKLIINPKWRNPIPFTSRPAFTYPQFVQYTIFLDTEVPKINEILWETTGNIYYSNCTEKCLRWIAGVPSHTETGQYRMILSLARSVEGEVLHPIGLQFQVVMDEPDPKNWEIDYVWFRGEAFRNFDHLLEAKSRLLQVQKIPEPNGVGEINLSSSLNFRGEPRPQKPVHGPRTYMPNGNRFTVSGRKIEWLGWEFEYSMLAGSGLQLFNIKFLKERIAYELSLQELAVFYSGGSPQPQHTTFYDSYVILGTQSSELFPDIDCPSYAQFFDFVHYAFDIPIVYKNSACVFEQDLGIPLRRHFIPSKMAQGMKNNALIFRQIVTAFNYDYIVDFVFYQAGQIEGKVSLSGYVISTYYTGPEMDPYGHVINVPTAMGNIHHHLVNFKADLDIAGRKNRFHTLDISVKEESDLLNNGRLMYNQVFKKSLKRTEKEAAYKFNFDTPKYLIIFNENSTNKFGYPRGYRILSEGMSKMLLPDDYQGQRARSWTEYQVAVTKQKEDERSSSSVYASMDPFDPVMSFEDFIDDDENIIDEDLVHWITLGTHHIPHSEDVPVVLTPGVQLRFYLLPYNYFDEDPSLASRDNIRTTPNIFGGHNYQYSGLSKDDDKCSSSADRNAPVYISLSLTLLMMVFNAAMIKLT